MKKIEAENAITEITRNGDIKLLNQREAKKITLKELKIAG